MALNIGIDLGTTNSAAAHIVRMQPKVIHPSTPWMGENVIPSVVAVLDGEIVTGADARAIAFDNPDAILSIKRLIGRMYDDEEVRLSSAKLPYPIEKASDGGVLVRLGDETLTPIEVSAIILRQIKSETEQVLGKEVTHVVVTTPAYFNEPQKCATLKAARIAGLNVLTLLGEPTAAAMAFGVDHEVEGVKNVLVYDLGGGTFDVSILMLTGGGLDEVAIGGDNNLGGDDFDWLLLDKLLQDLRKQGIDLGQSPDARRQLRDEVERAKKALSKRESHRILIPKLRLSDGSEVMVNVTLHRSDFESLIADRIEETMGKTDDTVARAKLTPEDIDYVVLAGGGTNIPLVRARLAAKFGTKNRANEMKLRYDVNAMECVALGAAIEANHPIEEGKPLPEDEDEVESRAKIERLLSQKIVVSTEAHAPAETVGPGAGIRVVPKDIGIVIKESGDGGAESAIRVLERGHPCGDPQIETFHYPKQGVGGVRCAVLEGMDGDLSDEVSENRTLGEFVWRPDPEPVMNTPLDVSISLDRSGVADIRLSVRDAAGEREKRISLRPSGSQDKEQELSAVNGTLSFADAMRQVGSRYGVPEDVLVQIDAKSEAVRSAVDSGDVKEASSLAEDLWQYMANNAGGALTIMLAESVCANTETPPSVKEDLTKYLNDLSSAINRGDQAGAQQAVNNMGEAIGSVQGRKIGDFPTGRGRTY